VLHFGSLKYTEPPDRLFVASRDHAAPCRLVDASTTTGALLAHEITNPNPLLATPKRGPNARISGRVRRHIAVGRPANVNSHPTVPGI
jgi:hypothetical protein